MDYLDELESMAQFAIAMPADQDDQTIDKATIQRWQGLFGYSYADASKHLQDHRAALGRYNVSEAHWELVRIEQEALGHDKESYEHSCQLRLQAKTTVGGHPSASGCKVQPPTTYLLKMVGVFDNAETIKTAGNLRTAPTITPGTDDDGNKADFCIVDALAKSNILSWLSETQSLFSPTFIRYSKAPKYLSRTCAYPTLGLSDTTLPQHRPTCPQNDPKLRPRQDEYPVWYFFYGTLADPFVLSRLLGQDKIAYRQATMTGDFRLTTWGGKYMALVDTPRPVKESVVRGWAFLVKDGAQEDALCCYETDKYEVVRCEMEMLDSGEMVRGLTFRFRG